MISHGRKYRSKKQRPCDLCRSRKIQCKLQKDDGACEICQKTGRPCTFVLAPLRRKRPIRLADQNDNEQLNPLQGCPMHVAEVQPVQEPGMVSEGLSPWPWTLSQGDNTFLDSGEILCSPLYPNMMPSPIGAQPGALGLENNPIASPEGLSHSPSASPSISGELPPVDWPVEYSLEGRRGYSNELIGLSNETDPYLLRHYQFDKEDTYTMFRLDFRRMVEAPGVSEIPTGMPVQFVMTNEDIYLDGVRAAEGILSGGPTEGSDRELLKKLVPDELGSRLVKLYSQHVHPHFPALSLSHLHHMDTPGETPTPVGIKSAVYALAAPFAFLDDELSLSRGYLRVPTEELWAIAHRSFHRASRLSHLTSLQLSLLLLHMPPAHWAVAEPPSFWALSCSSVAIAESLGLNLDPTHWRLPREEIRLRRRLWWLTHMQHTWQAVVMGRASHINDANWDVSPPVPEDFEDEHPDADVIEAMMKSIPICLAQCTLGVIVADMLKEFYTVKAVRESSSLDILLRRAQPLRARIEHWRQSLPLLSKPVSELDETEFEIGAALRLAHLTLEILIYRALLRPLAHTIIPASEQGVEPISTILENSYTCAKVATEVVSSLKARHFAAFWSPYTRNQLCYISTFILINLAQSPTHDIATRNKTLLDKWRDVLRAQSQAWPVARLATIRLDAVFWKGLSAAVHGTGQSPALLLVGEHS